MISILLKASKILEDYDVETSKSLIRMSASINKYAEDKMKYAPLQLSLGVGGTSIISPGDKVIHEDGSVNILFFFRGGSISIMDNSPTNAVVVLADAGGMGGEASKDAYGSAKFINESIDKILNYLKAKYNRQDIKLGKMGVASFSGGYNAVFGILSDGDHLTKQPDYLGMFDGMHHTSYTNGKKEVDSKSMEIYQKYAERAKKGDGQFVITHSAIKPQYSSTTETSDWLLNHNNMTRQKVDDKWNGKGVKPVSSATNGNFSVHQIYDQQQPNMGDQHMKVLSSAVDYLPTWA